MLTYRPFLDGPHHLAMGLRALDPDDWVERDLTFARQVTEKRRLLEVCPEAVAIACAGSLPAQRETAARLLAHLESRFPEVYTFGPEQIAERTTGQTYAPGAFRGRPLELAARLIQEDLCLLEADGGAYVLTAGMVCFPSRWALADKIGKPLATIHTPVPGYEDRLERAVDRFFASLRPERPVWRLNWSLVETDTLHLPPEARTARVEADPETIGDRLFLRVERQTLRRMPETGAILFTIRTYVDPLPGIIDTAEAAQALIARLTDMPDPLARYKNLEDCRPALVTWLEWRAAQLTQAGSGLPTAG